MAEWLLIRLAHEPRAPCQWLIADSGRVVRPAAAGTLAQAAQEAPGRRVCLLVDAADVLLTEAEVPARAGSRLAQLVPYALEEQLADEIDSLHFAVGRREGDAARVPVAVVARALMDEWLAAVRAAGITPECLYAGSLLPANPGQAVMLLDGDNVVVRPVGGQALTLPVAALAVALELAQPADPARHNPGTAGAAPAAPPEADPAADAAAAPPAAYGLVLYADETAWQRHQPQIEAARSRFEALQVRLLPEGPLALFAQSLPTPAAINLLQGPYAPQSPLGGLWQQWRLAASLFVGLLLLHAAGSGAQLTMLRHTESTLDRSIGTTFRSAMPGEHSAIDARRRMEQRLLSLRNGADSAGMLAMLAAVARARQSSPQAQLQALSYRDGLLELKMTAPGTDALDQISRQLRSSGWQADLTSASRSGSGYEGSISIKPGS
ncbi:MAG TPA: type II secretion system protein GspL [Steroidobacteraceae bacterium]|nr:type II secretion system protein GspL [Steroidobacteraceae bacterium]